MTEPDLLTREGLDAILGKSFIELMGHGPVDAELAILYLAACMGLIAPNATCWKDVVYAPTGNVAGEALTDLMESGMVVADGKGYVRLRDPLKTKVVRVDPNAKTKEEGMLYNSTDGKLVDEDDCHPSTIGPVFIVEGAGGRRVPLEVEAFWP